VFGRSCSACQRFTWTYPADASLVELRTGHEATPHSALADWPQKLEGALRQVALCGVVQCSVYPAGQRERARGSDLAGRGDEALALCQLGHRLKTMKLCSLTFRNRASYMLGRPHCYPPYTPFYIFFPAIIRTEFFKHAAHSLFFPLQNVIYFIMLPVLVPVLFVFYIQGVLKFKCQIPVPKG
jgi:hypothetical protein